MEFLSYTEVFSTNDFLYVLCCTISLLFEANRNWNCLFFVYVTHNDVRHRSNYSGIKFYFHKNNEIWIWIGKKKQNLKTWKTMQWMRFMPFVAALIWFFKKKNWFGYAVGHNAVEHLDNRWNFVFSCHF